MIRAPLSTTSVLDESASVVRATASPWVGLLLITSLPYRFMQAVFADRIIELGSNASQYGDVLRTTADFTCLAFLLSLWGRAVYARACRLTSASGAAPGREALRVPLAALASYVLVASIAESVTYLLFVTVVGIALGAILSGLAVGTMELNDSPGVFGPLCRLARYGKETRVIVALSFVFFCGFVVALLNVATLFAGCLELVSTIGGWDAPRWHVLLSFSNRRYILMIIAGALLVIEPFWIAANVLLVRKAGAAESGDDLRVWFEETPAFMRRIVLVFLLLLAASPMSAGSLTLAEYEAALTRMRTFIQASQVDAARAEAKALDGSDVDSPNGRFRTDSTLLAEVNAAKPRDLGVLRRISVTLSSLRGAASMKPAAVDAKLMQRLQSEQTVPELPRGGDIRGVQVKVPLLQRIGAAVAKAARWTADKIVEFVDWLGRFWPDSETKTKKTPPASGMRWTIGSLVALIILVLGVLAFEVIRRSRKSRPPSVEESAPLRSSRDDDPLSRGANEWERYAAQLAAAGRTREAIRAWYNAVLVTLYGANFLQFRKGRTNWEYVAALAPALAWRPQIIHLTRRFEEEWYGSDHSSTDALDECSAAARHILDAVRRTRREAA